MPTSLNDPPLETLELIDRQHIEKLLRFDDDVLAIDPGDNTGVYRITGHGSRPKIAFHTVRYADWLTELQGGWLSREHPSVIVCEQFISRPSSFAKDQRAPFVCGTLDLYAKLFSVSLHYQSPATVKTMLPAPRWFKMRGWEWKTKHEHDALKHLVYYMLMRDGYVTGSSQAEEARISRLSGLLGET